MIFKQLAMTAIFFFKMRPSNEAFVINIPCKFNEETFINDQDVKVFGERIPTTCTRLAGPSRLSEP